MELFKPGTVYNPPVGKVGRIQGVCSKAEVTVPARMSPLAFDISDLANPLRKMIYTGGEFALGVEISTTAKLRIESSAKSEIVVENSERPTIVAHAASIMQKALHITDRIIVEANNSRPELTHGGFSSSSALETSVAIGINEIYGRPMKKTILMKYLAQNHGEEITGSDETLVQIQCIGGAPAVSLFGGGAVIIAGENTVIMRTPVPEDLSFVFGLVDLGRVPAADVLMREEEKKFPEMLLSARFSRETAWRVLNQLMPALAVNDFGKVGDFIRWYKTETNVSATNVRSWPKMEIVLDQVNRMASEHREAAGYFSSARPIFYALTDDPSAWTEFFTKQGLHVFASRPDNKGAMIKLGQ